MIFNPLFLNSITEDMLSTNLVELTDGSTACEFHIPRIFNSGVQVKLMIRKHPSVWAFGPIEVNTKMPSIIKDGDIFKEAEFL